MLGEVVHHLTAVWLTRGGEAELGAPCVHLQVGELSQPSCAALSIGWTACAVQALHAEGFGSQASEPCCCSAVPALLDRPWPATQYGVCRVVWDPCVCCTIV